MTGGDELAAIRHLQHLLIAAEWLVRWDEPERRGYEFLRRAAARMWWIEVGNGAEGYRRAERLEVGVEPWAGAAMFRNKLAHTPGHLVDWWVVQRATETQLGGLKDLALKRLVELGGD